MHFPMRRIVEHRVTNDPAPDRRPDLPDARRRRRVVAALLLVGLGAGFALLRRGGGPVEPGPDRPEETVADLPPPPLAVPPPRASSSSPGVPPSGGPAAPGTRFEPPPAERLEVRSFVHGFLDPTTPDAPELPGERVPLDVEVVGPDGMPVRFADVGAWWGSWRTQYRRTDAQGRVRLDVPRHTTKLEVLGRDVEDPRPFLWVHYHLMRGDESFTRVVVRTGGTIEGTLVDEEGTPISGALISAAPMPWGAAPVLTAENGRFEIHLLADTTVDLRFDGERRNGALHVLAEPSRTTAFLRDVRVGSRGVRLVARRDPVRADFVVRVRDEDGAPVRCVVVFQPASGTASAHPTNEAGSTGPVRIPAAAFELAVVEPTGPRDPVGGGTSPPPWPFEQRRCTGLDPAVGGLDVVLRRAGTVRGRVVDPTGLPVSGASVQAWSGRDVGGSTTTDADGSFTLRTPLPLGTPLTVEGRAPNGSPLLPSVRVFELGGPALELRLRPGP